MVDPKENSYILAYIDCAKKYITTSMKYCERDKLIEGIPLRELILSCYLARKQDNMYDVKTLDQIEKELRDNHIIDDEDGKVRIAGYSAPDGVEISSFYIEGTFYIANLMDRYTIEDKKKFICILLIFPFFHYHYSYDEWELSEEWKTFFHESLAFMEIDFTVQKNDFAKGDMIVKQVTKKWKELCRNILNDMDEFKDLKQEIESGVYKVLEEWNNEYKM